MPHVIIISGGGEQDYREGANPYGERLDDRENVAEDMRRQYRENRDDARSERAERRYQRGRTLRRT